MLRIRDARADDLDAIVRIAAAVGDPDAASFLVSGFQPADYEAWIADGDDYFLVAEFGGAVVGFLLAFPQALVPDASWLHPAVTAEETDAVLIKQVAVDPERRRGSVGRRLYGHLFELVGERPTTAAVVVDDGRANDASASFHRSLGFVEVGTMRPADGLRRVHYLRPGRGRRNAVVDTQYEQAVALYLHEDTLNWTKLNNLFYINAGLGAVVGLFSQANTEVQELVSFEAVVLATSVFGVIVSASLAVAIWSGVTYLRHRKATVADLEVALAFEGGRTLVGEGRHAQRSALARSPTEFVLRGAPIAFAAAWTVVAVWAIS